MAAKKLEFISDIDVVNALDEGNSSTSSSNNNKTNAVESCSKIRCQSAHIELSSDEEIYDSDLDPEYNVANEPPPTDSEDDEPVMLDQNGTPPTAASTPAPHIVRAPQGQQQQEVVENTTRRSRKRQRNSDNWERNKKSREYNSGKRYKRRGEISERKVGNRCQCIKFECKKISDEEREGIHQAFWSFKKSLERQNYIVNNTVKKRTKKRQVVDPKINRGENMSYFLPWQQSKARVCKMFFMSTLNISDKMISYNQARASNGVRQPAPRRNAHNKTSEQKLESIRSHIRSLPKVESHYCRKTTKREYLEAGLNKRKLFRLYQESNFCEPSVKEHLYCQIFDNEFNLGFHKPSNDICDVCDKYTKAKAADLVTEEMEELKSQHDNRKQKARQEKEIDKGDNSKLAIALDLQQVLTAPRLFAGSSYYKRKLNVYNLTIYELPTKEGYCYTWHEGECHRGANDIASCIIKYLEMIEQQQKAKHVVLYSDTCGGQNRNRIVCSAILSFLSKARFVKVVEQKFFESGHSHMECDSMHSAIEHAFVKSEVYLPSDYHQIMRNARTQNPYKVIELLHNDIIDYDQLNSEAFKKDAFRGIINCHHLRFEAPTMMNADPSVQMGCDIGELGEPISYRKRGGRKNLSETVKAYSACLGVDGDKKRDLLSLIEFMPTKAIAKLFYDSLLIRK